jgi:hypothetical protein
MVTQITLCRPDGGQAPQGASVPQCRRRGRKPGQGARPWPPARTRRARLALPPSLAALEAPVPRRPRARRSVVLPRCPPGPRRESSNLTALIVSRHVHAAHGGARRILKQRQTRSPIPVPPIPALAGKRGENPRFPTRPGTGNGAPIANRGAPPCEYSTILGWMLPLGPSNADSGLPPPSS